jgi:hypothetical protein
MYADGNGKDMTWLDYMHVYIEYGSLAISNQVPKFLNKITAGNSNLPLQLVKFFLIEQASIIYRGTNNCSQARCDERAYT